MEQQMTSAISAEEKKRGNVDDADYSSYLQRVQKRYAERTAAGALPVFTTDANEDGSLWDAYLGAFPVSEQSYHRCHACRKFIENYSSLVVLDDAGEQTSAIFDVIDTPDVYLPSIQAVLKRVRRARVTGVFLSSDLVLGSPFTGIWQHFALVNPIAHKTRSLTPFQAMSAKREDHHTVARALADFSMHTLEQAVQLLKADALYRSEKVLGQAEWLLQLHTARRAALPGRARDNVLWRAIATAPAGFCHPRASMIGTLLEDIEAGMSFVTVAARFKAKMHPLAYQRPQAPPSSGNVKAAEELIAKLGLERSLQRRFARVEEIQAIWRPRAVAAAPTSSVFGHLRTKDQREEETRKLIAPPSNITFCKFRDTVLPNADSIELLTPHNGNYGAFVTAEHADAPAILQWDMDDHRNPVSWYVYSGGSTAGRWNLLAGQWAPVNAVSLKPSMWHEPEKFSHHGNGAMFVLKSACDTLNHGLAIFPETLKSELREVRSVLEAFSNAGRLSGVEEASACGMMFGGNAGGEAVTVRVHSGRLTTQWRIDRWD